MSEFKKFESALLRNNIELQKRKFGRNNDVPDQEDMFARRDYVMYRLGASYSELESLKSLIENTKSAYDSISPGQWERIEALIHSQNHVTYCFDNLIFNLASMSDYFGNYISLYLYGPKFQNVKWSGFVNKSLDVHRELEFGELVALENREWFTKIHSFRGDIIHKKVLKAQIDGFEFTHFNPQEVPKLDFKINSKLKQYFHIFRDNGDNDLFRCALKISNRTLQGMMNLMEGSEKIAFDKKHHWTSKL